MDADTRADVLKRLNYIDGHLQGVRKMIDVMKQAFAVRRAIEKMEAKMLDGHLHHCVAEAVQRGETHEVFGELVELYRLANK